MDVAKKIGETLQGAWELENITMNDGCQTVYIPLPKLSFRYDEFDSMSPELQILIENFPTRSVWVISGMYKMEHRVRITIYQKLTQYRPIQEGWYSFNTMDVYRKIWYSVKHEIDRILIKNKFSISQVNNLIMGSWTDRLPSIALGRGTKTTKEPIVWQSELETMSIYYQNETLEAE